MGASQSKRNNKLGKFRTSSVGAVGDFAEEQQESTNSVSNSIGKLAIMKSKGKKIKSIRLRKFAKIIVPKLDLTY